MVFCSRALFNFFCASTLWPKSFCHVVFTILKINTKSYKCFIFQIQKEEMGEVLHEVDFNQLKIENSQYLEKIDERNQDLLRLKLMAGNVLQVLNTYKVIVSV